MPETRSGLRTAAALSSVLVCLALLAAHFYRAGIPGLAVALLALGGLVFVRKPWAGKALQWILALGALEWLRTLVLLSLARLEIGQPFLRLVLILGVVAAATAWSAKALSSAGARRHFKVPGNVLARNTVSSTDG